MKYSISSTLLFISLTLFSLLALLFSPISQASSQVSSPYIQLAQASQSLDSAVQSIKQKTGGRILSAKTVHKNGQRVHKIKVLLPSGKVQVFRVNAQ